MTNHGDTSHLVVQEDLDQNFLYQRFLNRGLQYPVYDFSVRDADSERSRWRSTSSTGTGSGSRTT